MEVTTKNNIITTEDKYCQMKRKALEFSSDEYLDSEDEWRPNNSHQSSDSKKNNGVLSENILEQEIGVENLEIETDKELENMMKECDNIVEQEIGVENLEIEIDKEQEIEVETEEDNNIARWWRGQPEKWKRSVVAKKENYQKNR